ARKSSAAFVGLFKDGKTDMKPHMPSSPENMTNALFNDVVFWADHDIQLNEQFNAWLLK
ncbi:MAG: ABC transporter substrate-binding protein, partial [Alphaproteobacteria bacterium]|nr:ABC transporter substrate-binding protein [Alphaproteobacteria bacterium]